MATNYKQPGHVLTLTAPSGGVVSGQGYIIGGIFVIALHDAAQTEPFEGQRVGVFTLTKNADASGKDFAEGEAVFWDNTEKRLDKTGTGFFPVGYVAKAAASAATSAELVLTGTATAAVAGG